MSNKRGLNQVITTILLIALALLALIIAWLYIKPTITELSRQIKTECVTLRLEPSKCILNSTAETATFRLKRNPGAEKIEFRTVKLLINFNDGDSLIREVKNLPSTIAQEMTLPVINFADLGNKIPKSFKVAAVIDYQDRPRVCSLSSTEALCEEIRVIDEGTREGNNDQQQNPPSCTNNPPGCDSIFDCSVGASCDCPQECASSLICSSGQCTTPQPPPSSCFDIGDPALTLYFSFNDSTATDLSGNGNNGVINGATPVSGRIENGFDFDGSNDYINAGSATALDNMGAVTVTAWIYPRSRGGGNNGRIVNKAAGAPVADGWIFAMPSVTTNALEFYVVYSGNPLWVRSAADSITLNAWNFVAVTWNGTSAGNAATLYINGQDATSTRISPAGSRATDAAQSLWVGNAPSLTRGFDGTIDEVMVFNKALNSTEITDIYNNDLCGSVNPLNQPEPLDCSGDTSWVTLNTWYIDLFTGDNVNEFWAAKEPLWQQRWTLDKTNNILTSNFNDIFYLTDITGNFIIEMGLRLEDITSFGFFLNDSGDTQHPTIMPDEIYYKWYGADRLRAYRDVGSSGNRRRIFGFIDLPVPPTRDVDVKLSRTGDVFRWEYRFPTQANPNPSWILMTNEIFDEIFEPDPTTNPDRYYEHIVNQLLGFYMDEGAGQSLRYVKFQADSGFPCT